MSLTFVIPEFSCFVTKLSNRSLLEISIMLFLLFLISEVLGAYLSHSISLFGDALSMSIDVLSYVCNVYGEYVKDNSNHRNCCCCTRDFLSSAILIDVIIPTISVVSLLVVTVLMSYDAVKILTNPPLRDDVEVAYLYGYATANLVVDLICSYLFYLRSENVFEESSHIPQLSLDTSISFDEENEFGNLDIDNDDFPFSLTPISKQQQQQQLQSGVQPSENISPSVCAKWIQIYRVYCSSSIFALPRLCINCRSAQTENNNYQDLNNNNNNNNNNSSSSNNRRMITSNLEADLDNPRSAGVHKNLNMMSAFTHIIGDTLRTIAIFVAALISSLTNIDGDICDAWAALLVAVTIFILCINLIANIITSLLNICGYSEEQQLISPRSHLVRPRITKYSNSRKETGVSLNTTSYSRVSHIEE